MEIQEELIEQEERRDRGFTLIELLIVIVILGVLSTIVVLSVRGITDQGEASACSADRKTLEVAYEAAVAKGGVLPTSGNAEDELVTAGLLRSESTKYNIDYQGNLSAVDATCVSITATAGTPGTISGGTVANFAALSGVVASPLTAWTTGQRVVLGDASTAYWNGSGWVAGIAP